MTRIGGASNAFFQRLGHRVDGAFSGTTDEILQWGACKWGFDEDVVRAVAVQESWWRQSTRGDLSSTGYQSFGILQVREPHHQGTWPSSEQSTAFNVDYALAWRRACFEGDFGWMRQFDPRYRAGDEWGCVAAWYSGRWYAPNSLTYLAKVKEYTASKRWLDPSF